MNVRFPTQFWTLPGTAKLSPHDFTLGGAATELSGAGDRFFSVYLASVGVACDTKCGALHKFVVVPTGFKLPAQWVRLYGSGALPQGARREGAELVVSQYAAGWCGRATLVVTDGAACPSLGGRAGVWARKARYSFSLR